MVFAEASCQASQFRLIIHSFSLTFDSNFLTLQCLISITFNFDLNGDSKIDLVRSNYRGYGIARYNGESRIN